MARRARVRALAQHTFEHRVRRILQETLPPELAAPAPTHDASLSLTEMIDAATCDSDRMTGDEAMLRVVQRIQEGQL